MSVGSALGGQRLITNVAAGLADTDAANVGELRGASQALGTSTAATLGGGSAYNPTTGTVSLPTFTIQGNTYTSVGSALDALNSAVGGGSVTRSSPYFKDDSTAGGAVATGTNALAAGDLATASGAGATAVGGGATASGQNSVAVGTGSTDGGQSNVVSIGSAGAVRRLINVGAGAVNATSTDAVDGSQLYQTNTQMASLGHAAVQYDTGAGGNTLSSISLQSDAGGAVIIHNLAPGVAPSDAATYGQVQAASANSVQYRTVNGLRSNTVALSGGSPGGVTISNLAPGVAGTDAVNLDQLRSYVGSSVNTAYLDQRISNLAALTQQEISQARSDAAGGTAIALAATGIRYDDRPGKVSIGGATSYYHGEAGIAFGAGATSDDGLVRINASVSASPTMTRPDVGAVIGGSLALN